MKRIILTMIAVLLFIPAALAEPVQAPPPAAMIVTDIMPGNAYLPRGAMVRAELLTAVNSGENKVGDKISFKVLENVTVGETIVIARGTVGEGYVKTVKRAAMFGQGGGIELDASSLKTTGGIEVPLTMDVSKYGGERHIEINYNNSIETALLSGLLPGSNQKIKAGTTLVVLVPMNVDLQVKPEGMAGAQPLVQALPSAESPYVLGNEWEYSGSKGTIRFSITKVEKKTIKGTLTSSGPAVLTFNQVCEGEKGELYITLKAKDKDSGKSYPLQLFFRADGTVQYIVPNSPKEDQESIILRRVAK